MWEDQDEEEDEDEGLAGQLLSDILSTNKYGKQHFLNTAQTIVSCKGCTVMDISVSPSIQQVF